MTGKVHAVPRPAWTPVPRPGCRNVEVRVLLKQPGLMIAQLRFAPDGAIDEHSASWEIDVVCLEGLGTTTIEGEAQPIAAGETIRWPAGKKHGLSTTDSSMVTLMVEHVGGDPGKR